MRIHQITHLFAPDELAGAALYTDLARYLGGQGHDIRVTTTFSYYPALRYRPEDRGVAWREETIEGIPVRRVGMALPQPHKGWRRLVPEISYLAALSRHGRFQGWTPDVVVAACPMLAQATVQRWLYARHRMPCLVILQDSMAHAATELGIIRNPVLGRMLHAFERWSLSAATRISTISEGMAERVNAITRGRVPCTVVPNWIHQSLADTIARRREIAGPRVRRRLFYSGNFGVKQGLPAFLADLLSARGAWTIDLHGAGAEADTLRRETDGWGTWLRIGPLLDEAAYVDHLLRTTACVVTQMPGVGANFLPSKLLPALAAGTPVLAVCEPASPLGREVQAGRFGAVVEPRNPGMLSDVLREWESRPDVLTQLSENALAHAKRFSRVEICGRYEQILREMCDAAKGRSKSLHETRSTNAPVTSATE